MEEEFSFLLLQPPRRTRATRLLSEIACLVLSWSSGKDQIDEQTKEE
jgi:hypothetical protein